MQSDKKKMIYLAICCVLACLNSSCVQYKYRLHTNNNYNDPNMFENSKYITYKKIGPKIYYPIEG